MSAVMKILVVSPYHGGSHQAWAEGYQRYGRHDTALLTLPARFWKWRMHGGAVTLARHFNEAYERPDLILATDMTDLTTFVALTRQKIQGVPIVLYMHENQLTYPLPENGEAGPMRRQLGERDLHYAFINFASMMTADHILFNSAFHQRAFFEALPNFLKHFPEYNELDTIPTLAAKSQRLAVGIDLRRLDGAAGASQDSPPLILWNQRWEYDKNPGDFFKALYAAAEAGIVFRLALCGENFRRVPAEFEAARSRLEPFIVHDGFADDGRYRDLLREAALTISTAHHEFFGISLIEAIYCQTFPLLPNRLSYPELLPPQFHPHCLYTNQDDLIQRLRKALGRPEWMATKAEKLAPHFKKYDWHTIAPVYDQFFEQLV